MNKLSIFAVLCLVSSAACDIKHFGDCDDDDWEDADDFGAPPRPPRGGSAGSGNASNESGGTGAESSGGTSSGGTSSGGVAGTVAVEPPPPPTPCSQESDCEPGFNCDYGRGECVPADEETCLELASEEECDERNDCLTVYAGTDCSCGPECTCIGGEPGCVCESFEFFQCEDVVE